MIIKFFELIHRRKYAIGDNSESSYFIYIIIQSSMNLTVSKETPVFRKFKFLNPAGIDYAKYGQDRPKYQE